MLECAVIGLPRFRAKYYPDECDRQQVETEEAIDRRLRVFIESFNKGDVEKVKLQSDKSDSVVRLLDAGKYEEF